MADKKMSQFDKISTVDSTTYFPILEGIPLENYIISKDNLISYFIDAVTGSIGNTTINTVENYNVVNKVAIIDNLEPNTIYIYNSSTLNSLTISGVSESWTQSSIAHIKFTSDSTISINYTNNIFSVFNSDTVPQSNKKHEISLMGADSILIIQD